MILPLPVDCGVAGSSLLPLLGSSEPEFMAPEAVLDAAGPTRPRSWLFLLKNLLPRVGQALGKFGHISFISGERVRIRSLTMAISLWII